MKALVAKYPWSYPLEMKAFFCTHWNLFYPNYRRKILLLEARESSDSTYPLNLYLEGGQTRYQSL